MTSSRSPMGTAEVAALLGVSTERVRQLDSELQPIRVGRFRAFDPARVAALAKQRKERAKTTDK